MSERVATPSRRSVLTGISATIVSLFVSKEARAASKRERIDNLIENVDGILSFLDSQDSSMYTLIAQTSQPSRASLALRQNVERYAREVIARNVVQRELLNEVKELKRLGDAQRLYAKAEEADNRIQSDMAFLTQYREKVGVDRFNLIVGNTKRI
jgi:hypothetical protein